MPTRHVLLQGGKKVFAIATHRLEPDERGKLCSFQAPYLAMALFKIWAALFAPFYFAAALIDGIVCRI